MQIETSQAVTLDRFYALIAVSFLYLAFIAIPIKNRLVTGLKGTFWILAFLFGFLHAYFAFFGELGGFEGLGFLDNKYLLAISLSATALVILFLVAAGSISFLTSRIHFPKSAILQGLAYLAGLLIVIHGLILGSDFSEFSGLIPQIFIAALIILLSRESYRLDQLLRSKYVFWPNFGLVFGIFLSVAAGVLVLLYLPGGNATVSSLNVHALHIQIAKQAQQGNLNSNLPANLANIPSLQGDRTRRFSVSFIPPESIQPNQDTTLTFQVYDASSGNQVQLFQRVYEKLVHMIVVDSQLQYFAHIHPDQSDKNFTITTHFPHAGQYHVYVDFQPLGAIEQQFAFTVNVGTYSKTEASTTQPDTNLTKDFGDYEVTLAHPDPLKATDMSIGGQTFTFTLKDVKSKQPITTLKPYLAAFGHLVMINETTYDYLHVHPTNIVAPAPNANGGPTVEFLPLGLYGPIKPGIYRVFAQFNPNGNLMVSDFTVEVK